MFSKDDRGVAAIEFAILLPLIMLSVFGVTEIIFQLFVRSTIEVYLRDSARQAVTGSKTTTQIQTELTNRVAALPGTESPTVSIAPLVPDAGAPTDEYSDDNENNSCDNGEVWKDRNRNGIAEKAGQIVAGNTVGRPGQMVRYTINTKTKFIFGSLSMLGGVKAVDQVMNYTGSFVIRNEIFNEDKICT